MESINLDFFYSNTKTQLLHIFFDYVINNNLQILRADMVSISHPKETNSEKVIKYAI